MEEKKSKKEVPYKSQIDNRQDKISLESFKAFDPFNIKGKVSSYWHHEKSNIRGLELNYYPSKHVIELKAPEVAAIWVPTSNVPFMTPLSLETVVEVE